MGLTACSLKPRCNVAAHVADQTRSNSDDFPGVHNVARVERLLDRAHDTERLAVLADEKIHLAIPHPVLAGAGSLHLQRAGHHAVIDAARFGNLLGPLRVDHEYEMEIPIAHVT